MGLGFVLLIYLIVCLCAAAILSLVFGVMTWRILRHAKRASRIRAVVTVILLPPLSVVCGLFGFILYGLWCEMVRGVDPGAGDSFRVQIGSGYQLEAIDTMDQAFIRTPSGEEFGWSMKRVGFDDRTVYFETQSGTFELIEKINGQAIKDVTYTTLLQKLQELGSSSVNLRTPDVVYDDLRWEMKDLAAIPLIFGVPGFLTVGVAAYIWRVRRNGE